MKEGQFRDIMIFLALLLLSVVTAPTVVNLLFEALK